MSKLNIWNTISVALTGKAKILDSGRELFGTVVKHGVNDKTVTVNVSSRHYNSRYKLYFYNTKSKQVHDQHNFCVSGDRVIITNCGQKLSATKAYYIKEIVKPFPRADLQNQLTKQEQENKQEKSSETEVNISNKAPKFEEKSVRMTVAAIKHPTLLKSSGKKKASKSAPKKQNKSPSSKNA